MKACKGLLLILLLAPFGLSAQRDALQELFPKGTYFLSVATEKTFPYFDSGKDAYKNYTGLGLRASGGHYLGKGFALLGTGGVYHPNKGYRHRLATGSVPEELPLWQAGLSARYHIRWLDFLFLQTGLGIGGSTGTQKAYLSANFLSLGFSMPFPIKGRNKLHLESLVSFWADNSLKHGLRNSVSASIGLGYYFHSEKEKKD